MSSHASPTSYMMPNLKETFVRRFLFLITNKRIKIVNDESITV